MSHFHQEINQPDEQISLAKAALYLSQYEYPHLDINEYLNTLDLMAEEIGERLSESLYPMKVIQIINQYLFKDLGYRGNTTDYYDPRNSFLNEVIDRRTGIPISLSLVYLEIAKRIDFPMVGIGMPGHFIIRPEFEDAGIFVDVFNQGEVLFPEDCQKRLEDIYRQPVKLEPHFLEPVSNQQILGRMLTNLKFVYLHRQQFSQALRTIELILLLFPNHPLELRDRGLLYYQFGELNQASQDLELYLAMLPTANDADTIRQLLEKMRQ